MNYQSQPIKLNQELSDLRDITKQIIEIFSEAYLKEHERYNSFLEEQIEALQKALDD